MHSGSDLLCASKLPYYVRRRVSCSLSLIPFMLKHLNRESYKRVPDEHREFRMRISLLNVGLLVAVSAPLVDAYAQTSSPGGWPIPDWNKPPITDANRKPAPRRSLAGTWGPADGAGAGTPASGVQVEANNGKPENQLP